MDWYVEMVCVCVISIVGRVPSVVGAGYRDHVTAEVSQHSTYSKQYVCVCVCVCVAGGVEECRGTTES